MPGSADEAGAAEEEYPPLLFSIAYRMTGSAGDAEDIVTASGCAARTAEPTPASADGEFRVNAAAQ